MGKELITISGELVMVRLSQ